MGRGLAAHLANRKAMNLLAGSRDQWRESLARGIGAGPGEIHMLKLMLSAAAVAVLVAGVFVALPGVGDEVSASTASASTVSAGTEPAKGDRLDRVAAPP